MELPSVNISNVHRHFKLIFRLKDEKTAPFAPRVVDVITDVSELAAHIPLTNGLNGSGLKGNAVC